LFPAVASFIYGQIKICTIMYERIKLDYYMNKIYNAGR